MLEERGYTSKGQRERDREMVTFTYVIFHILHIFYFRDNDK